MMNLTSLLQNFHELSDGFVIIKIDKNQNINCKTIGRLVKSTLTINSKVKKI